MKHSVFRFGNTYCEQTDGTAIGLPRATDWATQIFAFYVITILQDLFGQQLRLDKRFVDDKIGLWKLTPNQHTFE